jgi:hypothetical protein
LSLSGIHFRMHQMIIDKLKKAASTSKEKAATIEEARFELEESQWLDCFAGIFLGKVKNTKDRRYYV